LANLQNEQYVLISLEGLLNEASIIGAEQQDPSNDDAFADFRTYQAMKFPIPHTFASSETQSTHCCSSRFS